MVNIVLIITMYLKQYLQGYNRKKQKHFKEIKLNEYGKYDLAHTLQVFTEDLIKKYVYPLKTCDNFCIAGGVAYNGYLNEQFTKHYENVYIPPAVNEAMKD